MSGLIANEILDQIQDRLDIAEIISGYIPLKKTGRNFKARCPFHHEKTPSFIVSPDKKIFHCFGCGAGGNIFGFVMKYERMEFPEAVRMLAKKAGVVISERASPSQESETQKILKLNELASLYFNQVLTKSEKAKPARSYLDNRRINQSSIDKFKLGFACNKWDGLLSFCRGKGFSEGALVKSGLILPRREGGYYDRFRNRIIFPIFDIRSKVLGFGGRVLDDSLPKYINSPETPVYNKSKNLYGLNFSSSHIRDKDEAVIVEGYLDFLTPFQSGVTNIAASLGTSLTLEQIRILKRFTKNAVMVYDGDQAGEAATLRGLDLFLQEDMNVRIVNLEKGLDPDSLIRKKGTEGFTKRVATALNLFDYKLGLLTSKFDPDVLEQKVAIIGEMLPTIARIQNEVLKSEYTKKLSESLKCEESAILAELRKTKIDYYEYVPQLEIEKEEHPVRPAEKMVVGIMLDDNNFIKQVMENLSLEEFIDPGIRQTVENIYEYARKNKKVNAGSLISHTNENLTQLIAEVAATTEAVGDKEKNIRDCIRNIKRENIREKMNRVQTKINMAQGSKDEGRINSLLEEYNTLLKEYKIWR